MDIEERIKRIVAELDALRAAHPTVPWAFVASPKQGEVVSDYEGDKLQALGLVHILSGNITMPIVMGSIKRVKQDAPRIIPAHLVQSAKRA